MQARQGLSLVLDTLAASPSARAKILSGRRYRYPHHPVADAVAHWEEREAGFSGYGIAEAQPERYADSIPPELRREPREWATMLRLPQYRRRQAELDGTDPPAPPLQRLRAWSVRWATWLGWRRRDSDA